MACYFSPFSLQTPLSITAHQTQTTESGACIYLGPNDVKQTLVARSSAKAEYRSLAALTYATTEILWHPSLLSKCLTSTVTK